MRINSYFREPWRIPIGLQNRGLGRLVPDSIYLKAIFRERMGYKLDLKNPQTFNEKLQWLKLYDRNPLYTTMVDKYAVKKYVADIIGEEYIIPTLGVWDKFDEINFDELPNQFVLKCTHDSGGLVICKDKSKLDMIKAKEKIERSLKTDYYLLGREWPYKNVPRRIIAEKYMEDTKTEELRDYKFFCFKGIVKALYVATDRQKDGEDVKFDFFDSEYKHLAIKQGHDNAKEIPEKPIGFIIMKELASKISERFREVRVDFYEVNGKVYFGEVTFFSNCGLQPFEPDEWDVSFGKWIEIPNEIGGGYAIRIDDCILWIHADFLLEDLRDYKFFCFNGSPEYCQVISNRTTDETIDFFNMKWEHQEFTGLAQPFHPYPLSNIPIPIPVQFDKMKEIAQKLSKGLPFVRVDLYSINDEIYFGEMTFYPASGCGVFDPDNYNYLMGDKINIV